MYTSLVEDFVFTHATFLFEEDFIWDAEIGDLERKSYTFHRIKQTSNAVP